MKARCMLLGHFRVQLTLYESDKGVLTLDTSEQEKLAHCLFQKLE